MLCLQRYFHNSLIRLPHKGFSILTHIYSKDYSPDFFSKGIIYYNNIVPYDSIAIYRFNWPDIITDKHSKTICIYNVYTGHSKGYDCNNIFLICLLRSAWKIWVFFTALCELPYRVPLKEELFGCFNWDEKGLSDYGTDFGPSSKCKPCILSGTQVFPLTVQIQRICNVFDRAMKGNAGYLADSGSNLNSWVYA